MWGLFGDSRGEDGGSSRCRRRGQRHRRTGWRGGSASGSVQHQLALPRRRPSGAPWRGCCLVLLTNDPVATAARLDAGQLACPSCGGELGPWGHARRRVLRGDHGDVHRPRRTRCRSCRVTHGVLSAHRFPRCPDTARTVGRPCWPRLAGSGTAGWPRPWTGRRRQCGAGCVGPEPTATWCEPTPPSPRWRWTRTSTGVPSRPALRWATWSTLSARPSRRG